MINYVISDSPSQITSAFFYLMRSVTACLDPIMSSTPTLSATAAPRHHDRIEVIDAMKKFRLQLYLLNEENEQLKADLNRHQV